VSNGFARSNDQGFSRNSFAGLVWDICTMSASESRWGSQAEALGRTPNDLFGLHKAEKAKPSYRRLSRYETSSRSSVPLVDRESQGKPPTPRSYFGDAVMSVHGTQLTLARLRATAAMAKKTGHRRTPSRCQRDAKIERARALL